MHVEVGFQAPYPLKWLVVLSREMGGKSGSKRKAPLKSHPNTYYIKIIVQTSYDTNSITLFIHPLGVYFPEALRGTKKDRNKLEITDQAIAMTEVEVAEQLADRLPVPGLLSAHVLDILVDFRQPILKAWRF